MMLAWVLLVEPVQITAVVMKLHCRFAKTCTCLFLFVICCTPVIYLHVRACVRACVCARKSDSEWGWVGSNTLTSSFFKTGGSEGGREGGNTTERCPIECNVRWGIPLSRVMCLPWYSVNSNFWKTSFFNFIDASNLVWKDDQRLIFFYCWRCVHVPNTTKMFFL